MKIRTATAPRPQLFDRCLPGSLAAPRPQPSGRRARLSPREEVTNRPIWPIFGLSHRKGPFEMDCNPSAAVFVTKGEVKNLRITPGGDGS
jgi:hypothetical protein